MIHMKYRSMTAVSLLAGSFLLTTAPAHAIGTNYTALKNVSSGKCLEIAGNPATTTYGTQADQWDCNGGDNQTWIFWYEGNGYYTIVNHSTGECLEKPGNQNAGNYGDAVEQWQCNGGINQKWYFDSWTTLPDGTRARAIINADNLCAEIPGNPAQNWNGALAQTWGCNGGYNQKWYTDMSFTY